MKLGRLLIVSSLCLSLACGSDERTPLAAGGTPATDGAAGAAGGAADDFGAGECRACFAEACASDEADCNSEPACAAYLRCIDACPVSISGSFELACAAACALPTSPEASILALHVQDCRVYGHGSVCGCTEHLDVPPLLAQRCEASDDEDGCVKCRSERCCASRQACLDDAECLAYFDCSAACTLASRTLCRLDCAERHPAGQAQALSVLACSAIRCPAVAECRTRELDTCGSCTFERCLHETVACLASPACEKYQDCSRACQEGHCPAACLEANDEGMALSNEYAACAIARCGGECTIE